MVCAKENSVLSKALGSAISVVGDWKSLKAVPAVAQSRNYVEITRNV